MTNRKILNFILLPVFVVLLLSSTAYAQQYNISLLKRFYSIGTAGINGTYYPLGGAIARLFNDKLSNIAVISEPTKGSIANVGHLKEKQIDLALIQSDIAFQAFIGSSQFNDQPFNELKLLASLYPEVLHIVVLNDSPIESIQDLNGKSISIGTAKSGSAISSKAVLSEIGIVATSCKLVYERFTKGTASLKDGYVDALMYIGGVPANGIHLLSEKTKIRFISIPIDISQKIVKKMPYITSETIKSNSYLGVKEDATTVGFRALLATTDTLDNKTAYVMVKTLFENLATVVKLSNSNVRITLKNALKGFSSDMLHPGARKYYEEKGVLHAPKAPNP